MFFVLDSTTSCNPFLYIFCVPQNSFVFFHCQLASFFAAGDAVIHFCRVRMLSNLSFSELSGKDKRVNLKKHRQWLRGRGETSSVVGLCWNRFFFLPSVYRVALGSCSSNDREIGPLLNTLESFYVMTFTDILARKTYIMIHFGMATVSHSPQTAPTRIGRRPSGACEAFSGMSGLGGGCQPSVRLRCSCHLVLDS